MIQFDEYSDSYRKMGGFTIRRNNPYGFWTIHPDKGRVPAELTDHYTSAQLAGKAVQSYLSRKKD